MKTIIFDFDGTLCDSVQPYFKLYNAFLLKNGREPISIENFRSEGLLELAKRHKISHWQIFWIVLIVRRYNARHSDEFLPITGIENEIKKLAKSFTLGIVTSNSKRNVVKFLKKHNLETYFMFVESKISYFGKAKKLESVIKTYKLQKDDCIYVGDESRDILAAKLAGIHSAAVNWGFESQSLISQSQPDITITKSEKLSKSLSVFFSKNT